MALARGRVCRLCVTILQPLHQRGIGFLRSCHVTRLKGRCQALKDQCLLLSLLINSALHSALRSCPRSCRSGDGGDPWLLWVLLVLLVLWVSWVSWVYAASLGLSGVLRVLGQFPVGVLRPREVAD